MDHRKSTSFGHAPSMNSGRVNFPNMVHVKPQSEGCAGPARYAAPMDVDIDLREIYFLITHFLSSGPCQKTFKQLWEEGVEHELLPRRYHAWYSRNGAVPKDVSDDGQSFPLSYENVIGRYSHIEKDHLVRLLKQLMLMTSPPLRCMTGKTAPSAADVPTLLGTGSFSLTCERSNINKSVRNLPSFLRWPHMQADQVRGLSLRELGGGFSKHHRAPSIRVACYAIAKPSSMVPKMQNIKKLRGHRDAVYCAIFDRSGRFVITGSDDRLVKIWSMETALCLASCRGHEGDITDLSVNSNNGFVASASNDFTIRVWRVPDGFPISVLRGHTGAVTAIVFSPRLGAPFHLLSSSDDGTCRIWDVRFSQSRPRVYSPKQTNALTGSSNLPPPSTQIMCCAYNANGTFFVTGSADTFARVWSACKPSIDDPDQVIHEIDILAGHENDVNYVQFSGCAVASRSSPSDSLTEDSVPKFKNSWFNHDNIVTCSRDGSAIIWVPRSRRSHGKVGRWVRAYHLKVPPPPKPPQPSRGGPRQRLLPTPRGVNMIIWSLDNRFVLAAIMDNRICVWNANDGSLVHSLAGHTASTYVLDVHPFNPRIAMSAGYDGKTILWDIWDGTPIRVYEIDGRFKLVDGKFSQDGTSIVLSDDVGQIYLLNTGEGESQKDAKYDQFFLGDYRPHSQDSHGNVVDQETQLSTYVRNIQDALCDSSMLPYPEPYQSTYQQRRLRALGIEWRPSSIKFAIGTDIGMGQDFQILPLADLDVVLEPLPDYADAMFWEPENDVMNDDNDSEYNVTEEYFSDEKTSPSSDASSDSVYSEDGKVRRNPKDSMRRSKRKKSLLEVEAMAASGRRVRKRVHDKQEGTSSRSKKYRRSRTGRRTSTRKSTKLMPSRPQRVAARDAINIPETSTDEEDEYASASDTSDSESSFEGSSIRTKEHGDNLVEPCLDHHDSQISNGSKKKLVVRFSLSQSKTPAPSEYHGGRLESQTSIASSTLACDRNPEEGRANSGSGDMEHTESLTRQPDNIEKSTNNLSDAKIGRIKFKIGKSNLMQPGNFVPPNTNAERPSLSLPTEGEDGHRQLDNGSHVFNQQKVGCEETNISTEICGSSNSKLKLPTRIKIKRKENPVGSPSQVSNITGPNVQEKSVQGVAVVGHHIDDTNRYPVLNLNGDEVYDNGTNVGFHNQDSEAESPDVATDSARRARSLKSKSTLQDIGYPNHKLDIGVDYLQPGTSRVSEKSSKKSAKIFQSEGSKYAGRSRPSRNKREGHCGGDISSLVERKPNWLLLTQLEEEEGYRYIPQLGDEVVYLRQGHQGYLQSSGTLEPGPWQKFGEAVRAVEFCVVEELRYKTHPGSGESCCRITLTFTDTFSSLIGQRFRLTLPDLDDFPDFIVERTRYNAAMERNWMTGDRCRVWWRLESGDGGEWYYGSIIAIKDISRDFPGSPWERFWVRYEDNSEYPQSPWELQDLDGSWEQRSIGFKSKEKILSSLTKLLDRASIDKDRYGIIKLDEVAQRLDFINRFPVPLCPEIIKSRVENNYYRSLNAVKHDIEVMLENAKSYFPGNSELSRKMDRLSSWFERVFSDL